MKKSNYKLVVRKQSIVKLSFNILDVINTCIGDGGGGGGATLTAATMSHL